jgi:hypothetical protein
LSEHYLSVVRKTLLEIPIRQENLMHSKPLARSNSRPTQHLGGRVRIPAIVGAILAGFFALPGLANATSISMPFIFSNGTVADADDVNANFAVLVDVYPVSEIRTYW